MMEYRIIGDIHGRDVWKRLIDKSAINVFVGDYFDPYDNISFDMLVNNFNEIIQLKKENNDNVILLYGNHDFHYMDGCDEHYSRFDYEHNDKINNILNDTKQFFTDIAYPIGDKYIVTHAGISNKWAERYLKDVSVAPHQMALAINLMWEKNKRAFSFEDNGDRFDVYGDSSTQSPLWIRPYTLANYNLYMGTGVKQIIGHTQISDIVDDCDIVLVDCLGTIDKCYTIKLEDEDKLQ